jgi:glycerol-3-phosphate dehydrogenase (NAD(P)+)
MKIAVLGAGAWGTAMAVHAAARHDVQLWSRDAAQARAIEAQRENRRYLAGVSLPAKVRVGDALPDAIRGAELLIVATPTAGLRQTLCAARDIGATGPLVWLCKGFERDSGLLAHQIVAHEWPALVAGPLSGPSFAEEVARGQPTALTVAGDDAFCAHVTDALHAASLRIYSSDDVVGVEVGGAVKNVLAIATGIAEALGLGLNARAALITRGLAEMTRLGVALGARAETFMGLAGVGDLILTCTGELSRNRKVGLLLGRGMALDHALADLGHVAEGVWSAPSVLARATSLGVDLPITRAVCAVLGGALPPRAALELLLAREPKAEVA